MSSAPDNLLPPLPTTNFGLFSINGKTYGTLLRSQGNRLTYYDGFCIKYLHYNEQYPICYNGRYFINILALEASLQPTPRQRKRRARVISHIEKHKNIISTSETSNSSDCTSFRSMKSVYEETERTVAANSAPYIKSLVAELVKEKCNDMEVEHANRVSELKFTNEQFITTILQKIESTIQPLCNDLRTAIQVKTGPFEKSTQFDLVCNEVSSCDQHSEVCEDSELAPVPVTEQVEPSTCKTKRSSNRSRMKIRETLPSQKVPQKNLLPVDVKKQLSNQEIRARVMEARRVRELEDNAPFTPWRFPKSLDGSPTLAQFETAVRSVKWGSLELAVKDRVVAHGAYNNFLAYKVLDPKRPLEPYDIMRLHYVLFDDEALED